MLQRGRAPESAECALDSAYPFSHYWLQRGRAPESAEWPENPHNPDNLTPASTGPRSGERGVPPVPLTTKKRDGMLQRGRAPESAEWSRRRCAGRLQIGLQRGRAPESAECHLHRRYRPRHRSFNGAALRRARSEPRKTPSPCKTPLLQRGRAPESAEWPNPARPERWRGRGFNGAALRRARSASGD